MSPSVRLFLLFLSLPVLGTELSPECVWAHYKLSYHEDYVCRECPRNALSFLQRIKNQNGDLSQFKVVFFKDKVVPQRYRSEETKPGWEWHVVVMHDNRILDPDFSWNQGSADPAIVRVDRYITENFGPLDSKVDGKPIGDVRVRVIEADYFVRIWGQVIRADRPVQQSRTADADHMMNADLGGAASDYSLADFAQRFR